MAISKVTLNGVTQMDVTGDTVVANHLLDGDTATGADGNQLRGTLQVDVVVDPTLSNTGEAADAKVTGDRFAEVNSGLNSLYQNQTFTFASGWQSLEFPFEANKTYIFTSSFSGGVAYTSLNGSSNLETIKDGFTASTPFEFTPTTSANYIRLWQSGSSSTLNVVRKDTVFQKVLYRYITKLEEGLFEHGSLWAGGDSTYNQGARIRTPMICNDTDITITTKGGTERALYQTYTADGKYTAQLGWYESTTIKKGTIFRLLLTNSTSSSTQTSISDILDCFNIVYANAGSEIPNPPTTNGTYTLRCVVSGGTPTYSWVSA